MVTLAWLSHSPIRSDLETMNKWPVRKWWNLISLFEINFILTWNAGKSKFVWKHVPSTVGELRIKGCASFWDIMVCAQVGPPTPQKREFSLTAVQGCLLLWSQTNIIFFWMNVMFKGFWNVCHLIGVMIMISPAETFEGLAMPSLTFSETVLVSLEAISWVETFCFHLSHSSVLFLHFLGK